MHPERPEATRSDPKHPLGALASVHSDTKSGFARAHDLALHAGNLPVLPGVAARVAALDPAAEGYFDGLLAIAQQDPNFAVHLIRAANASASAPGSAVLTVRQAMVRLGAADCARLVSGVVGAQGYVPRSRGDLDLWRHALQVAVAARTLAAMAPTLHVAPDEAYLAGLLHDIGRFVMLVSAIDDLHRVEETHWHTPEELLHAEHRLLGYDHVQLGVLVCRHWTLPAALCDLVVHHHDYAMPESRQHASASHLVRIVQLADRLSVMLMMHPQVISLEPAALATEITRHGLRREWRTPPVDPTRIADRLPRIAAESAALFDALAPAGA